MYSNKQSHRVHLHLPTFSGRRFKGLGFEVYGKIAQGPSILLVWNWVPRDHPYSVFKGPRFQNTNTKTGTAGVLCHTLFQGPEAQGLRFKFRFA